jgi:hypothetical protein
MEALQSGKYDLNKTSVMITQTGGGAGHPTILGFFTKSAQGCGLCKHPGDIPQCQRHGEESGPQVHLKVGKQGHDGIE